MAFDKTVFYLQLVPHGSVATDSAECSVVGTDIMKNGGNAVDAAIAATFCLGVVNPHVTGLGGWAWTVTVFSSLSSCWYVVCHCAHVASHLHHMQFKIEICNILLFLRTTLTFLSVNKYFILHAQRQYKSNRNMRLFCLVIRVHFVNGLLLQWLQQIGEDSVYALALSAVTLTILWCFWGLPCF